MTQSALPVADVVNDGWVPVPVYAQTDAAPPTDGTFVTASPCGAEFLVRLARLAGPVVGPNEIAHALTVRLAGPASVLVELLQNDAVVAWDTFAPGPGFNPYTLTLTRADAAKILYQPGPAGNPNLQVRVTALGGSGSGLTGCVACLQRLCVTTNTSGYVTGVYYTNDHGASIEVLGCGSGGFVNDPNCVACLGRLCASTDGVALTGVFYTDDDGTLIAVPVCGSGGAACITTCPQCSAPGMSAGWNVIVFGEYLATVTAAAPPPGGNPCQFDSADGTWNLQYETGDGLWVLTDQYDGRVWYIAGAAWDCVGSNTLAPVDAGQADVVLVPVYDCPGGSGPG